MEWLPAGISFAASLAKTVLASSGRTAGDGLDGPLMQSLSKHASLPAQQASCQLTPAPDAAGPLYGCIPFVGELPSLKGPQVPVQVMTSAQLCLHSCSP